MSYQDKLAYEDQLAELMDYVPPPEPGEQQSVEWLMQRVGKATGSEFSNIMAVRNDKKEAAPRYNYRMELVCERLTGRPSERYVSKYMEWGTQQEAPARMAYEARTGAIVMQPGFTDHPTIAMCGGSVDGLVNDDGIIEIKALAMHNHIQTLLYGMADEHRPQTQGYLWITGRQWCDFISFDPRFPAGLQLYIQRVQRDDVYIALLSSAVILFLQEVAEMHGKLLEISKH